MSPKTVPSTLIHVPEETFVGAVSWISWGGTSAGFVQLRQSEMRVMIKMNVVFSKLMLGKKWTTMDWYSNGKRVYKFFDNGVLDGR